MIRGVYGDQERYEATYFGAYKGYYFSGDGARRDEDGYYWITGRVDDVINSSGHRIGTAEVESALVLHEKCAEAAVVAYEHPIKGQGIYAYVTLMDGVELDDAVRKELVMCVVCSISIFFSPCCWCHACLQACALCVRVKVDARCASTVSLEGERAWLRRQGRVAARVQERAEEHRAVRGAGRRALGAGPAQDAQRQDHAAHPAQDRERRARPARRRLHPRGPGNCGAAHRAAARQARQEVRRACGLY